MPSHSTDAGALGKSGIGAGERTAGAGVDGVDPCPDRLAPYV